MDPRLLRGVLIYSFIGNLLFRLLVPEPERTYRIIDINTSYHKNIVLGEN